MTQKHRFMLKQVQRGLYLNSSRFGLNFQECACACASTHMRVTYFSVYTCWLIQKGYYYNQFPTAPREEKVATWYLDTLLFEHFSLKTQEPSQLRNCFQYLVASRTEGNCRYPASISPGSVCCSLSCLSGREGCCMFREQLLMQFLALLSLSHAL